MPRLVAFLRAINVGGRTVRMETLRGVFEKAGLQGVETVIASGNVLFDAARADAALERKLEGALQRALGYEVATFVRSAAEMSRIAGARPFAGAGDIGGTVYVAFLRAAPGAAARRALLQLAGPVDDFRVVRREVYWLCRTRSSESKFSGALLEKTLGLPATLRNTTTVLRIAEKLAR